MCFFSSHINNKFSFAITQVYKIVNSPLTAIDAIIEHTTLDSIMRLPAHKAAEFVPEGVQTCMRFTSFRLDLILYPSIANLFSTLPMNSF